MSDWVLNTPLFLSVCFNDYIYLFFIFLSFGNLETFLVGGSAPMYIARKAIQILDNLETFSCKR